MPGVCWIDGAHLCLKGVRGLMDNTKKERPCSRCIRIAVHRDNLSTILERVVKLPDYNFSFPGALSVTKKRKTMKLSKKTRAALKRSTKRALKEAKTRNPIKKFKRKRRIKECLKRANEIYEHHD